MDNHNDEQIEELKAFWTEYGQSIITGVVLAIITVGGWNFWTGYQTQKAEEASSIYYTMIEAYGEIDTLDVEGQRSEKVKEFLASVESLKSDYRGTEYAYYAALQNAKYLVEQNQLEEAADELKQLVDAKPHGSIKAMAQLRLARVLYALEKYDDALKYSSLSNAAAYDVAALELQGDIYYSKDNKDKALESYQKAREASEQVSPTLDMKYYNLLN